MIHENNVSLLIGDPRLNKDRPNNNLILVAQQSFSFQTLAFASPVSPQCYIV